MNGSIIELPSGSFYQKPFDILNAEGYEFKPNYPNCCPYHENVFNNSSKWFSLFPNCCDRHRGYSKQWWYKRKIYKGLPLKINKQINYTTHHLKLRIDSEDWFDDFVFFVEYNIMSFGVPAIGEDRYIGGLKYFFKEHSDAKALPAEKVAKCLGYLESLHESQEAAEIHEPTSFAILFEIHQRWLKIFPFSLSYFKDQEMQIKRTLPFVEGPSRTNPYTGLTSAKVLSPSQLIYALANLTKVILSKVDSIKLLRSGAIPDPLKHQIALTNEAHRINQSFLLQNYDPNELLYLKVIEQWLQNEKKYFLDVTPLLRELDARNEVITIPEPLSGLLKEVNRFRRGIPMTVSINHFKVLTERKSKNGKPFLSEEQLTAFINRAFLKKKDAPKVKVNLSSSEKGFFIKRFYEFYVIAVSEFSDVNKSDDYISLVADNFNNGWTRQSIKALFRSSATKESW